MFSFSSLAAAQNNTFAVILCLLAAIIGVVLFLIVQIRNVKLKKMAYRDDLTGLPTTIKLYDDMHHILSHAKSGEYMVLSIDLNNYRYILDSFGQETGRTVLSKFAACLKQMPFTGSIISRVYMDNFAVFAKSACLVYIEDCISGFLSIDKCMKNFLPPQFQIQFSCGVYYIDDNSMHPSSIIEKANTARIIGKKSVNFNRVCEYTKKMQDEIQLEQEITFSMEKAFTNHEFVVFFQPKYSFTSKKLIGAEALIRWNNPRKGMLTPGQFVPLFERNGFIQQIDLFVFETVCRFLNGWNHSGTNGTCPRPLTISCNLSRVHLYNPNLTAQLKDIASHYDIAPSAVELELTESSMFENHRHLLKVMNQLKDAGFSISIDDFGSGYSSLNFLKDMPADVLKLDKGFLNSAEDQQREQIIIKSVIDMAKNLNLETVAEGIETTMQFNLLKSMGCDIVQGFLFAYPMSEADFKKTLISGTDV